ncbi:FAD-dependent oxidoreductase [uncultured Psychrobacter sp.]|uniref:FAD-dependent oxidoreductase n=1 Tax=uncultured Psychrobacter sp. TaxID=259303 RepID=UPI0034575090
MKLNLTPPLKPSYWQQSIAPVGVLPALTGEHQADIVIIGGGFVGLWTALTIKEYEPDCKVVVLEQDICGGGASGRNGGMVMSWWPKISSLNVLCSPEESLFLANASERAISELGEFCLQHNIDAHFVQKGWLWTATTPAHVNAWDSTLKVCERLGAAPFERLSVEDLQRRTGSSSHLAGVLEASNATVQPFALVQGMRRVALEKGVSIYEKSGVTNIVSGNPVQVQTKGGVIAAQKVVLATNAWSTSIPALARTIAAVNSSIVVTKRLNEQQAWQGGECITDSQLLVNYYRKTHDGRIAFGKGTGAMSYGSIINEVFSEDTESIDMTRDDFFKIYSTMDKEIVEQSWSGPIDRTFDSLPVFGSLSAHNNIFYGIGWSGNGVGPSRLGGRILASIALERDNEWSQCSLVDRAYKPFPPEPFRYLGGRLVRRAVIRKEQAEMSGRDANVLDRWLAGLAPAGLEDK